MSPFIHRIYKCLIDGTTTSLQPVDPANLSSYSFGFGLFMLCCFWQQKAVLGVNFIDSRRGETFTHTHPPKFGSRILKMLSSANCAHSHTFPNILILSQLLAHFLILSYTFSNFLILSCTFSAFGRLSQLFAHFLILSHNF
jgi:hypothetical protein